MFERKPLHTKTRSTPTWTASGTNGSMTSPAAVGQAWAATMHATSLQERPVTSKTSRSRIRGYYETIKRGCQAASLRFTHLDLVSRDASAKPLKCLAPDLPLHYSSLAGAIPRVQPCASVHYWSFRPHPTLHLFLETALGAVGGKPSYLDISPRRRTYAIDDGWP